MASGNQDRDKTQLSLCNEITSAIKSRDLKTVGDVLKHIENRASILRNEIMLDNQRKTLEIPSVIQKPKINLK